MKYLFIILFVAVSFRLSAQIDTTDARQNTSGQVNSSTSDSNSKVGKRTKAGQEGTPTSRSVGGKSANKTVSGSNMSKQSTNSKASQKGKTPYTKRSTGTTGKPTGPSKNANNKNGSKTNSNTTTSGSGKKDM